MVSINHKIICVNMYTCIQKTTWTCRVKPTNAKQYYVLTLYSEAINPCQYNFVSVLLTIHYRNTNTLNKYMTLKLKTSTSSGPPDPVSTTTFGWTSKERTYAYTLVIYTDLNQTYPQYLQIWDIRDIMKLRT